MFTAFDQRVVLASEGDYAQPRPHAHQLRDKVGVQAGTVDDAGRNELSAARFCRTVSLRRLSTFRSFELNFIVPPKSLKRLRVGG